MTAASTIRVQRDGSTAILTIARPEAKNALSRRTVTDLEHAVRSCADDDDVRCIILTGDGTDVFVSGGDLREFAELATHEDGADEVIAMGTALSMLERCSVPVIAALQGSAFGGGCELMLTCDMAVLESHVTLSFRQAAMGLSTGWGGATRLIERVGPSQAARLLLCGDPVGADEALRLGLAVDVVERGQSVSRACKLAERIARFPRDAIGGLKSSLWQVLKTTRADALAREATVFRTLWGGASHRAALNAFLSKKKG
jgi:enoyl-CoA hydratase